MQLKVLFIEKGLLFRKKLLCSFYSFSGNEFLQEFILKDFFY